MRKNFAGTPVTGRATSKVKKFKGMESAAGPLIIVNVNKCQLQNNLT
jgi:hypothetical protein